MRLPFHATMSLLDANPALGQLGRQSENDVFPCVSRSRSDKKKKGARGGSSGSSAEPWDYGLSTIDYRAGLSDPHLNYQLG